ncbi:hypothetical protein [Pseudomonas fluorescens]|uniref:hypothetical protein n=1 Tax=Pseudomonas fluorescens TaxID=294 RepID=UPI0015526C7F|nr:hypothetical protein [Pseudomonas fluorescens]
MTTNTRIWDQVDTTDPSATKNFTGMGGFKGTAIKPTYLMHKATEVFGPCGEGWGWTVLEDRYDEGAPLQAPTKEWPDAPRINAKLHTLKVELWYLGKDGQKCTIVQYGHTPFVYLQSGKIVTDWEVSKKSLTDAIGKCMQPLGFAADIHMGLFDDPTYVDTIAEEFKLEKAEDKDAEMLRQKQERIEWLASAVETIGKAVTTHELKLLNVKYIREATRRNEPTFIARITRAFEERKASLEKGTEAAA